MSRIGNAIISLPSGVDVNVDNSNVVTVKGPKGELKQQIDRDLTLEQSEDGLELKRPTDQKRHKAMHGLYRSLISNMIHGVTEGYETVQELIGVGYRVSNKGNLVEFTLGYSHPIFFYVPDELQVETKMEKGNPPTIILRGVDKQLIGQVAAKIRAFRKPEPYKGKGIRFAGEILRRKAGKTAAK